MNQDLSHLNQAKRNRDATEKSLSQLVRETWKWLMAPSEMFIKGRPELNWEVVSISPASQSLVQAIESKLREEEWVVYEWAPIHLRKVLADWYLKDGKTEVNVLKLWQDCCNYLYLPRLVNADVFRDAVSRGAESKDYFGYAAQKEGDRYLGFAFGERVLASLDDSAMIIDREVAAEYADQLQSVDLAGTGDASKDHELPDQVSQPNPTLQPQSGPGTDPSTTRPAADNASTVPSLSAIKTHFYGTVTLDPVRAKMDFASIIDEVVEHFTVDLGVEVSISIEIQASKASGFDDRIQRTVKENCNTLRFNSAEFERE